MLKLQEEKKISLKKAEEIWQEILAGNSQRHKKIHNYWQEMV
jgi:hypothetical protein